MLPLRGKRGGRLDPSLQWIASALWSARSAVAAVIARLKTQGFWDWVRRSPIVDDPARPDQYVEQISDAYFFTLPARAADLVRRMLRRPTEAEREEAERAASSARIERLVLEGIVATVADADLRDVLTRLSVGLSANPSDELKGPCAAK